MDDVRLPGMVYGHMVRSPYAQRSTQIHLHGEGETTSCVLAIITGEDLAKANLAWMTDALSISKWCWRLARCSFRRRKSRRWSPRMNTLLQTPRNWWKWNTRNFPPLVDPHKATDPSSPILREDREEKSNHIFHWEVGDRTATDKVFQNAAVKASVHAIFSAMPPAPLETCGCVADSTKPQKS